VNKTNKQNKTKQNKQNKKQRKSIDISRTKTKTKNKKTKKQKNNKKHYKTRICNFTKCLCETRNSLGVRLAFSATLVFSMCEQKVTKNNKKQTKNNK